jgi:hypothetical protein
VSRNFSSAIEPLNLSESDAPLNTPPALASVTDLVSGSQLQIHVAEDETVVSGSQTAVRRCEDPRNILCKILYIQKPRG